MVFSYNSEIFSAFQVLEDADPEWLKAIVNRPTGSQWGRVLKDWSEIASLRWHRLTLGKESIDFIYRSAFTTTTSPERMSCRQQGWTGQQKI